MTNREAKEKIFYQWQDFLEHNIDYAGISTAYKMAIKAFEKLDQITAIIHNTQGIQEDVIRYKMICEVMENDE